MKVQEIKGIIEEIQQISYEVFTKLKVEDEKEKAWDRIKFKIDRILKY